jgi:hypothetical protein
VAWTWKGVLSGGARKAISTHASVVALTARGRGLAGYPPTGAARGADLSLFGATCARWWARERVGRLLA